MIRNDEKRDWDEHKHRELQLQVMKFKKLWVKTINKHCRSGLSTLKFFFLDHVVEHLYVLGTMSVCSASTLEK